MKERLKNLYSFLLRFGLSALLLAWLFSRIDFKHMWDAVKGADLNYMLAAGVVFFGINFIIMWRWMILMGALGLKFEHFHGLRWFFIGLSCNLFLPTSVGGDVVKGMGMAKETGDRSKVFASILLDRLSGFTGIVLVAFLAFLGGRKIVGDTSIVFSILTMTAVSVVLMAVLFNHRLFSWATHVFSAWPRLKNGLMELHYDLVLMKDRKKEAAATILLSAAAQLILAFEFYLTAKGMHQDIHFIYFVIFSPLVCVATALPSIGGLGVREVGWVYLLSKVGVPQGVALGLSLINFGFMVLIGLVGALFYVITLSPGRVQYRQTGAPFGRSNA